MYKFNIGTKTGKTFKAELEAPALEGKELGQVISGEEVSPNFTGYEFEITGASDSAGFTSMKNIDGIALRKVTLKYGKGMRKRSKREGKKLRTNYSPQGLKLRKTVRGKTISPAIVQINLRILKQGNKNLDEIFPEQVASQVQESQVSA